MLCIADSSNGGVIDIHAKVAHRQVFKINNKTTNNKNLCCNFESTLSLILFANTRFIFFILKPFILINILLLFFKPVKK